MTYAQQIKDPRWQKKRLEVLEHNGFECLECGATDQELHVHHPYYRRGAMIWEYETTELQCLCHKCHKDAHAIDERLRKTQALACPADKWQAIGVLDAQNLWCRRLGTNTLKIENFEHGAGVAGVFSIPTEILFPNLTDGQITLPELEKLRRMERIKRSLNVFPPAIQEEIDALV